MLICPLATIGLDKTGISGWAIELPRSESRQSDPRNVAIAEPSAIAASNSPTADLAPPDRVAHLRRSAVDSSNGALSAQGRSRDDHGIDPTAVVSKEGAKQPKDQSIASSSAQAPTNALSAVAWAISATWLLASFVLVTRLAAAWRQLGRIRQRAVKADKRVIQTCQRVASALNVGPPDVLHSPCLPSPCLTGIRRPAVLLPEADDGESIREVLIHELAHLRRHDCHWNLLRADHDVAVFLPAALMEAFTLHRIQCGRSM